MIILDLPWPPSVNTYWRHPTRGPLAGRHLISAKGRAYRQTVLADIQARRIGQISGRLSVHVDAYPPDNRRRDLDNIGKALLDALVHASIIRDDGDIDRLSFERVALHNDGFVRVFIKPHTKEGPVPL